MNTLWKDGYRNPILGKNEVHIWRSNLTLNLCLVHHHWQLLAQDEKKHANQFYFEKDKIRYIVSRGILRKIISEYIKYPPEVIQFEYANYGKPYLNTAQNSIKLYFNLGHSHNSIVYVITKNFDIGVDIEMYQNNFDLKEVAKFCFSRNENKKLHALPKEEQYDYFYKIWTLKEAFTKALGVGLSYNLKKVNIELINQENYTLILNNCLKEESNWMLQMFSTYTNYYAAFVTKQPISKVLYLDFDSFK